MVYLTVIVRISGASDGVKLTTIEVVSGAPADVTVHCADPLIAFHGKHHMSEFYFNGNPSLCSGSSEPHECWTYIDHEWIELPSLSQETERPTVIEYPSSHATVGFWVTGKYKHTYSSNIWVQKLKQDIILGGAVKGLNATHNTTEYYDKVTNTMKIGPPLPYQGGLYQHCLAWKDDVTIILLGGVQLDNNRAISDIPKLVYEFNTQSETFTPLPELPNPVRGGGCKVIHKDDGEMELLVLPGNLVIICINISVLLSKKRN